MKKFNNFILISLIVLTCSPILASCHGKKEKGPYRVVTPIAFTSFDEARDYELTFWAKNDTNATQLAIYNKAISDFEAIYPNIKVKMRSFTDYNDIYNNVITNIATETTPNICITYPDHIATYLKGSDVVAELDDYINNPEFGCGGVNLKYESIGKDQIISKFLDECKFNGSTYAVPFMRSTEACYINKTYVESLGYTIPDILTWDFVFEVSAKAMELKKDDQVLIPFIYKSTDNMMIQMLKQKESGYTTENGNVLMFNDTTSQILQNIAYYAGSKTFSTFKISSYPGNFLNANQCIFAIDSTAGATWMGSNAPLMDIPKEQVVQFETEVKMIPQFDINNPQMISQGPSICIFNKQDKQEVIASWIFTQYLLSNQVQIDYSKTEGYVPVTSKAQNDPAYIEYLSKADPLSKEYYDVKIKASKLLLDNIDNTFTTPVFDGSTSVRNAAGQMIESACKYARKKKIVDDRFVKEIIYPEVQKLYRLENTNSLGKLPNTAIALLVSIGVAWIGIIGYFLVNKYRAYKKNK